MQCLYTERFASTIYLTIRSNRALDINDQAAGSKEAHLYDHMNPALKGGILLSKSRSTEASKSIVLSVLASMNKALDNLTTPSGDLQPRQHNMIAEAMAQFDFWKRQIIEEMFNDTNIGLQLEQQNIFCGAIIIGNLPHVGDLLTTESPVSPQVNLESPFFGRPLQIATAWGRYEIVTYLLERGADPHSIGGVQDATVRRPTPVYRLTQCYAQTYGNMAAINVPFL